MIKTNTLRTRKGVFMSPKPKTVFLFANSPLPEADSVPPLIKSEDFLVAVDGGLRHLVRVGLVPDLIIGDLDSAEPEQVKKFRNLNVEVRQFAEEKDQTDLELAVFAALEMQPARIRIVGALGGRLDQTLANIFMLTKPELSNADIRLVDPSQEAFLIRQSAQLAGQAGQRVSLLPLNGQVDGIRTSGLKYPLNNETLYPDQTRGISNVMESDLAAITIGQGVLLCIHEFSN